jgi:hypothetical protein
MLRDCDRNEPDQPTKISAAHLVIDFYLFRVFLPIFRVCSAKFTLSTLFTGHIIAI